MKFTKVTCIASLALAAIFTSCNQESVSDRRIVTSKQISKMATVRSLSATSIEGAAKNLSAVALEGANILTWESESDAKVSFKVERVNPDGTDIILSGIDSTFAPYYSLLDTHSANGNLQDGQEYTYTVYTLAANGTEIVSASTVKLAATVKLNSGDKIPVDAGTVSVSPVTSSDLKINGVVSGTKYRCQVTAPYNALVEPKAMFKLIFKIGDHEIGQQLFNPVADCRDPYTGKFIAVTKVGESGYGEKNIEFAVDVPSAILENGTTVEAAVIYNISVNKEFSGVSYYEDSDPVEFPVVLN